MTTSSRTAGRLPGSRLGLLLAAAVLLVPACSDSPPPAGTAPLSSSSTDAPVRRAVAEVAEGSARLLDVRTPAEWNEARAEGAVHLDLARIQAGELPPIDREERIYVYCRTGNRAGQAIEILEEAGFTDLVNIGGLGDWQGAGGPVEGVA